MKIKASHIPHFVAAGAVVVSLISLKVAVGLSSTVSTLERGMQQRDERDALDMGGQANGIAAIEKRLERITSADAYLSDRQWIRTRSRPELSPIRYGLPEMSQVRNELDDLWDQFEILEEAATKAGKATSQDTRDTSWKLSGLELRIRRLELAAKSP